jgi:hypothetical protein
MRTDRFRQGVATTLPGLLLLLGLAVWPRSGRAASACPPAVTLQGDVELGERLGRALKARGLGDEPVPGCPMAIVQAERIQPGGQGGQRGISVLIVEVVNQRVRREFATEDLAAAFIESWVRRDLSGPLLAGLMQEQRPSGSPPAPAPAPRPGGQVSVAARGVVGLDSEGAAWAGADVLGCGRVGPVCVGGALLVRGALTFRDTVLAYPEGIQRLSPGTRLDLAGLLIVDLPVRAGRVVVMPGAGLGAGWLRTTFPMAQPSAQMDQGGLRLRGQLTLSIPLPRGLAVDVGLHADFSLATANTPRPTGIDTRLPPPQPMCMHNPNQPVCQRPPAPLDPLIVPWGLFSLGAGLRWGGPA